MSANPNIRLVDNAIERNGGLIWNRLQSERKAICETLIKKSSRDSQTHLPDSAREELRRIANRQREPLQARLRKIDDALDRLMSGSYGVCSECGKWIEDTKLAFDPAIAFCISCWQCKTVVKSESHPQDIPPRDLLNQLSTTNPSLSGVELESLTPFDTIWLRTHNSEYRIFLLDPRTGRALVEGGRHFVEPAEATVSGSTAGGSSPENGWIGIGLRVEILVNGALVRTSPVTSVRVEHHTVAEAAIAAIPNLKV